MVLLPAGMIILADEWRLAMKSFNERGYIFIAFAFLLPLFILFMSLVLELGRGYYRQTELQNVVQTIVTEVTDLQERYESTLDELETKCKNLSEKVAGYLKELE